MPSQFDIKAYANAWNTHQVDRLLEFYADNAEIIVPPDSEPYRGKAGVRENFEEVTRGMEDINGDVAWSVQQGDKVAVLVHVTGKHTGPMPVSSELVIPATGRSVRFQLGLFFELDGQGKIKRETDLADNIGLLQQVGALDKMQVGTGSSQVGAKAGRER